MLFEKYADLAHLVERDLAKVEVAGSSPVIRSKKKSKPMSLDFLLYMKYIAGQVIFRLALRFLYSKLFCFCFCCVFRLGVFL